MLHTNNALYINIAGKVTAPLPEPTSKSVTECCISL